MAAFRKAIEMGAKAIELDVHQTLDHELVVCHDDDLRRTGRDRRLIRNLRWDDARKIDVGSWFDKTYAAERLPTLAEVYNLLPKSVELHLELKRGSSSYPGIEERVVDMIHHRGEAGRTLISSFDHAALYSIRSLDAKLRLGYLLGMTRLPAAFKEMGELKAESLNMSLRQVTPRAVTAAKDRGYKVLVYTVNTPMDRDRLKRLGVDGVFCNYPELDLWR